ncbi:arabinose metabolism transcriptional repressor-like [Saccostrea echinata]|uniref:arabinose metabolism transcriptional repressor-like n=1 Tax=Saccostrea echinata TaxID=191078 RepID=UPI002A7FE30F|nr:arabinose metabolism transcriptional repressor-like [Saccostrea echinata]
MPKKRAHIVMEWLQEQIQSRQLDSGERVPTEKALCQKFHLSRSAVRNALSQLHHSGWLQYEKNRGYSVRAPALPGPARPAAAFRKDLGLLCFFPSHYIFPDVISGFSSIIDSQQYNIIIKQSEYQVQQERQALQELSAQGIAGLVAMPILDGVHAPNKDLYMQLIQRGTAVVFVCSTIPGIEASSILCCDLQAGRRASEVMLAAGFRDFILFYQKNYLTKAVRMQGAREVLQQAERYGAVSYSELAFVDQGQHSDTRKRCSEFFAKLERAMHPEPMAWLCSSDEDAAIVIEVARSYHWELHRDYELLGFDNSQLAELLGGGFSSFTVPGKLIGRMAARYLLDQMAEAVEQRHCINVLVQSNLIRRNFHNSAQLKSLAGNG